MPEDNSALVTELESSLAVAKASLITSATEIDTYKTTITSLQAKVTELEATMATVAQEKMTLSQELQKMVAEVKATARKNALIGAGATEAKAAELITKFAEASDEMFEMVIALIVREPVVVVEAETEVETDEVAALETVTDVETPVTVLEDNVSDRISSASQWLRNSVLETTKNLK